MIKPYYEENGITIYHGDCREIAPKLGFFDLLLTDPPYGISVAEMNCSANRIDGRSKEKQQWDSEIFNDIQSMKLAGKNYVIWGGNYYNCFVVNGGAIIWDKLQPLEDSSQCEIAAISKYRKVFKYTERWTNFVNTKETDHPTEKPISLMQFCINIFKPKTIFDPFAGSGTTGRAAKEMGLQCTMIEKEEKYCEIAVKRLAQGVLDFAS